MESRDVRAEAARINDEGTDLMAAGEIEAAAAKFREALTLHPGHALSWYNLGVTQHESGDKEGALASYREAVKHDPAFVNAWSNIGWALLESGALEDADPMFDRAIEVDPDYAKSYVGKGHACLFRGDLEKARGYYAMALERDPMSKARLFLEQLRRLEDEGTLTMQFGGTLTPEEEAELEHVAKAAAEALGVNRR